MDIRRNLDEDDGQSDPPPPVSETIHSDAPLLPSGMPGWKKASEVTPADIGRELTADEKYENAKQGRKFARDVAALQRAEQVEEKHTAMDLVAKEAVQQSEKNEAEDGRYDAIDGPTSFAGPASGGPLSSAQTVAATPFPATPSSPRTSTAAGLQAGAVSELPQHPGSASGPVRGGASMAKSLKPKKSAYTPMYLPTLQANVVQALPVSERWFSLDVWSSLCE